MKPGSDLARWLADPAAQARSLEAINAFVSEGANRPLFKDLKRDLDALAVRDLAGVRAAVERFMDREEELQALFGDMIAAAAADPFWRPPFPRVLTELTSGLLLFEDPLVFLALSALSVDSLAAKKLNPADRSSINFTGTPTLFRFVRSGGATLSFWEAPEIKAGFAVDTSGQCRMTSRRLIEDGEMIMIDGRRESFVIEHATSDMVYLYAAIRAEEAPLAVEYDSRTHGFVGASTTDEASSRVQMMISLLRMLDRQDALPLFVETLKSPHFYTRWHVMREFLAMDAEAALPHLRAMAESDPHPDCRAAARQTIDTFFADEEAA